MIATIIAIFQTLFIAMFAIMILYRLFTKMQLSVENAFLLVIPICLQLVFVIRDFTFPVEQCLIPFFLLSFTDIVLYVNTIWLLFTTSILARKAIFNGKLSTFVYSSAIILILMLFGSILTIWYAQSTVIGNATVPCAVFPGALHNNTPACPRTLLEVVGWCLFITTVLFTMLYMIHGVYFMCIHWRNSHINQPPAVSSRIQWMNGSSMCSIILAVLVLCVSGSICNAVVDNENSHWLVTWIVLDLRSCAASSCLTSILCSMSNKNIDVTYRLVDSVESGAAEMTRLQ